MKAGDMSMLTGDLLRLRPPALDLGHQRANRLGRAPLRHRQHPTFPCIGHQGDVVVTARARGLVDRHLAYRRQIGQGQCRLHVALADRSHPMSTLAHDPRRRSERHLPAQHQHRRLEQQREPRQLAAPGRFHLPHAPIR
jgi:hypothetical protein